MRGLLYATNWWSAFNFTISLVLLIGIGVLVVKTILWEHRTRTETSELCERMKTDIKCSVNKIASLSPTDLEAYLTKIFGLVLELTSAEYISERDPQGRKNLYKTSLAQFIYYLGDSYDGIEFYYGTGYVINWFSLHYRLLDLHGEIDKIVHKTTRYTEQRG